MLGVGNILIVGSQDGEIVSFDYANPDNVLSSFKVNFIPRALVHPPTYLNKILIVGDKDLELRNIRTTNLLYRFINEQSTLFKYIEERLNQKASYINEEELLRQKKAPSKVSSISLLLVENSPALDVVALGFSNGEIVLLNLKQDQIIQIYKLKDSRPVSIAFSQTDLPLLAVGTDKGDIVIFNLNEENILSTMKNVHKGSVNYLEFLKDELTLLSGSYADNSLLMWQYDELEDAKFRILRKRSGLSAPIRKLRFYGDEGYHVIASSFGDHAEIKDYFLWNEGFEGTFSMKKNKKLKHLNLNTENIQETSQITDFSFSSNRAKDWSNLLTSHKNFDKPYLWSTEDHTIIKKNVQWDDQPAKLSQITQVFVTQCGNFGILGYADGNIVKINMQSGIQQKNFHQKLAKPVASIDNKNLISEVHNAPITGIFVDAYNTVLVSGDNEYSLVNWDFYSGGINKVLNTFPSRITMIRPSKTANLFCVVFEDFKIEVYDQYSFNKGRSFFGHRNRVMDVCFTKNNRQVVSSALDCTIKVWDIISSNMVNNIVLKTPVISLDFDPSGEFLVTAFSNSKEIYIWNNRIGQELMGSEEEIPLKFVSEVHQKQYGHSRKKYLGKDAKKTDEQINVSEQEINDLEVFFRDQMKIHEIEEKNEMVAFFEQDIGKWLPLIHFDEIREKNKPKQAVETNVSAPFFLEFDNRFSSLAAKMEGTIEEEKPQEEKLKTKIVRKENRNQFLEEVASNLEGLVLKKKGDDDTETFDKMLVEMKKLTPAQVDYEIRMMTFGKMDNVRI